MEAEGPRHVAFVYLDGGRFLVQSAARSHRGVWLADGPVVVVTSPTPAELGRVVLIALANSRVGVPHPAGRAGWEAPRELLRAAGVRSYDAFTRFARLVTMEDDGQLSVWPSRAVAGGYERLERPGVRLHDRDAGRIARALIDVFRQRW
ncbi:hypothetical protein [Deinococcus pimensis]|uniref:hypothetical protein n=1 Tax=Deinococcus pimensis TaxID=309888 RepID=UPI0004869A6E|nr:hypothetical protein [Deinococcus pimensis]